MRPLLRLYLGGISRTMADSLSRLADAAAVALFGDAPQRRLPFAVTPRMKEIASTTAAPARSLIVAAYIVGTGVLHSRGTFSATLRGLNSSARLQCTWRRASRSSRSPLASWRPSPTCRLLSTTTR